MSQTKPDYQAGYWQYRVVIHPAEGIHDEWVGLHEVFYDSEGSIRSHSEAVVVGDDLAELRRVLGKMLRDIERHPVLEQSDLPPRKEA